MDKAQNFDPEVYTRTPQDRGTTPPRSPSTSSQADQTPPLQHSDDTPQPRIIGNHTPPATDSQDKPSSSSHQEYLDSLQPPSDLDFARLCSLQEGREKEHRHRNNDLKRQDRITALKSMEARRDFMKTKVLKEGEEEGLNEVAQDHHGSGFGHRIQQGLSQSRSPVRYINDNDGGSETTVKDGDYEALRAKAATVIQRSYRGYRAKTAIMRADQMHAAIG
ncbi:hypothetical protein O1611_g555 [Lasiodiplodia mahajangana]|uniref:Uncharacterized protein n=1 Tax=Lasiodiplodia mahajangana TaxID=1108764 RepID=A0ACC2K046_9PEZI|nr:hypothetical protein O1611_g555 [Lasiodiplodia mahajangana]